MSQETQRIGYITLKNDLDCTIAKMLDFDQDLKLNPPIQLHDTKESIIIH